MVDERDAVELSVARMFNQGAAAGLQKIKQINFLNTTADEFYSF
jgi:hypothetical protein